MQHLDVLEKFTTGRLLVETLKSNIPQEKVLNECLKLSAAVVQEACGGHIENANIPRVDLASAVTSVPAQSFILPRGKFDVGFMDDSFALCGPKGDVTVPYSSIRRVVIIDSVPGGAKDKILLFIALEKGEHVMYGRTKLESIVLQTRSAATLDIPGPANHAGSLQGPAAVVLCQLLGLMGLPSKAFTSPDQETFQTAKGRPALTAYYKTSDGALFPLSGAFCFVERPALYLSHDELKCAVFTRAGSQSTFDICFYCKDGTTFEFTQLEKQELGRLESYLGASNVKVLSEEDANKLTAGDEDQEMEVDQADDEDDEDDEDFRPEGEDGDLKTHKRRRPGAEAVAEDEDEEDEEDDDEVELVDEEGISAEKITALMQGVAVEEPEDDDDEEEDGDDKDFDPEAEDDDEEEMEGQEPPVKKNRAEEDAGTAPAEYEDEEGITADKIEHLIGKDEEGEDTTVATLVGVTEEDVDMDDDEAAEEEEEEAEEEDPEDQDFDPQVDEEVGDEEVVAEKEGGEVEAVEYEDEEGITADKIENLIGKDEAGEDTAVETLLPGITMEEDVAMEEQAAIVQEDEEDDVEDKDFDPEGEEEEVEVAEEANDQKEDEGDVPVEFEDEEGIPATTIKTLITKDLAGEDTAGGTMVDQSA